jgi:hypothetical protein
MKIFESIKIIFDSKRSIKRLDNSFIFPYSADKEIKRKQIWDNLQKGLLFENTQVFISWLTPYSELDNYAEQRKNNGDRINWFLGQHKILDGLNSYVGVTKWIFKKDNEPFSRIDEFLGFDYEGNQKFLELKEKFTDLLGEPTYIQLEKFGNFDLGGIEWSNQKISIYLSGIEQFACKYRLYIGLKEKENE